jgi:hypothetical protein
MPHITGKSLHFSLNVLKKPLNFLKTLHHFIKASIIQKMYLKTFVILEKPSHQLKKASISLKMSSKRMEIFKIASIHFKKPQIL